MSSWFCDKLAFAWRGIHVTGERAVMLVKIVTYFGDFRYLNSSCIKKKDYFSAFEFLET